LDIDGTNTTSYNERKYERIGGIRYGGGGTLEAACMRSPRLKTKAALGWMDKD